MIDLKDKIREFLSRKPARVRGIYVTGERVSKSALLHADTLLTPTTIDRRQLRHFVYLNEVSIGSGKKQVTYLKWERRWS